jgi:hypothetical protein
MSVAELQKRIGKLSPGKRRALAKYTRFLERQDTPSRRQRLSQITKEMDAGKKYTLAQVNAILLRNPPKK